MRVIKVGGGRLDQRDYRRQLAGAVAGLAGPTIVVHGGGQAVDSVQRLLGSEPERVDGLRRTTPEALEAALMVLCGQLRGWLVAELIGHGIQAFGLSGFDGGTIRVRKLAHPQGDLGWVGDIVRVETGLLLSLLQAGFLPVVSPLSLGTDGQIYNVNADEVAAAIAESVQAHELAFISDVSGVQREGELLARLNPRQSEQLIADNEISAGMIPKVRAAAVALDAGVRQVRIVDLPGLVNGGGTMLTAGGR